MSIINENSQNIVLTITKGRHYEEANQKADVVQENYSYKKDKVYVGLDVHKRSISVAIWINGQMETTFNTPADYPRLIELSRVRCIAPFNLFIIRPEGPKERIARLRRDRLRQPLIKP